MDWVKIVLVLLAVLGIVFILLMWFPPTRIIFEMLNIKWSGESIGVFNDLSGGVK